MAIAQTEPKIFRAIEIFEISKKSLNILEKDPYFMNTGDNDFIFRELKRLHYNSITTQETDLVKVSVAIITEEQ